MQIKKISSDFGLNVLSSIALVMTMQLFVYPKIASTFDANTYGSILTIMAVINTVLATFGNGLNNLRLITNEEYHREGLIGDFNLLLVASLVVITIGAFLSACYFSFTVVEMLAFWLIVVLAVIRTYLSVSFRMLLNYKKILLMNLLMSTAYILATIAYLDFHGMGYWYLIFLLAEVVSVVYLVKETDLLKEPFVKTELFSTVMRKYGNLIYLTLMGNLLLYMDRNLLYPLLGGAAVAIFFAATMVGKTVGIVIQPMAGVLLSYFSQVDFVMNRKKFWKINLTFCMVCLLSYIVTIFVADFVVQHLYASLYQEARPYLYLANLIPFLGILGSMAQPAVLRYVSLNIQSLFQTIYLVISVGVSYFFAVYYGLLGFCYAAILLSVLRIGVLWWLGDTEIKGKKQITYN